MDEQVVVGNITLELNNQGAALRIGKFEIIDEIQQTVNFVRAHVKDQETKDRIVSDLKHHLKLVRNL